MQCAVEKCNDNYNYKKLYEHYKKETLQCDSCKRLVHYSCTQLPEYQLVMFLTNCYSEYVCFNCVASENNISKPDFIVDRNTKIEELDKNVESLKLENQNIKSKNAALILECRKLREPRRA